ncbi:MAG: sulfurtransferase-like selenium metabolism protein YedF [Candidatus Cloacimonetes bacterium]|nr:sulfurtransferase-like selenium metabolism protein YedF [Candidatus Cloacimonadota bacterium]
MKIIDALGQVCPVPLILLKKAIKEAEPKETMMIIVNNDISKNNILTYLKDNDYQTKCEKSEGNYKIIFSKEMGGETFPATSPQISKRIKDYVVVIKNDKMGFGECDLGEVLLKGFINALAESDELPNYLIFYNAGVKMTVMDSPVIDSLHQLEENGVKVLICGACVDYFRIEEQIKIGTISNMMSICEVLQKTGKVIYP